MRLRQPTVVRQRAELRINRILTRSDQITSRATHETDGGTTRTEEVVSAAQKAPLNPV